MKTEGERGQRPCQGDKVGKWQTALPSEDTDRTEGWVCEGVDPYVINIFIIVYKSLFVALSVYMMQPFDSQGITVLIWIQVRREGLLQPGSLHFV